MTKDEGVTDAMVADAVTAEALRREKVQRMLFALVRREGRVRFLPRELEAASGSLDVKVQDGGAVVVTWKERTGA